MNNIRGLFTKFWNQFFFWKTEIHRAVVLTQCSDNHLLMHELNWKSATSRKCGVKVFK